MQKKVSNWMAERSNAHKLSELIVKDVIPGILNVINDEDVKRLIHTQFNHKLQSINFGEWLGASLDTLTKDGRHQELLTTILEKLHDEFHSYRHHIHTKVSEKTPLLTFGFADEPIANGIIDGINEFLRAAKNPSNDVRNKVDHYIIEFIDNLKHSQEMQEVINGFIHKLSNNQEVTSYINGIWNEVKTWIYDDLSRDQASKIKNSLTDMFENLGIGLSEDESLKQKINDFIKITLLDKLIEYKESISNFIASTVKSWDTHEVSEKLELEIGKDLQFIRLNGTLVGGLIGIVLFLVAHYLS